MRQKRQVRLSHPQHFGDGFEIAVAQISDTNFHISDSCLRYAQRDPKRCPACAYPRQQTVLAGFSSWICTAGTQAASQSCISKTAAPAVQVLVPDMHSGPHAALYLCTSQTPVSASRVLVPDMHGRTPNGALPVHIHASNQPRQDCRLRYAQLRPPSPRCRANPRRGRPRGGPNRRRPRHPSTFGTVTGKTAPHLSKK